MIIDLILVVFAAVCDSITDSISHYDTFKKWGKWWSFSGWELKYVDYHGDIKEGIEPRRKKWLWGLINKPVQVCDAWHFFKMLMLLLLLAVPFVYSEKIIWYIDYATYGLCWNMVFSLFYNVIWKKKTWEKLMKK